LSLFKQAAFFLLTFWFCIFWQKNIGTKVAYKKLMKSTSVLNLNKILQAAFLYKKILRSFSLISLAL